MDAQEQHPKGSQATTKAETYIGYTNNILHYNNIIVQYYCRVYF